MSGLPNWQILETLGDESGCLARRDDAISGEYEYGPRQTEDVNATFWRDKAAFFGVTVREAMQMRCKGCSHFNVTSPVVEFTSKQEIDSYDADSRGSFGFCQFHEFKASSNRTCGAWTQGGPIRR